MWRPLVMTLLFPGCNALFGIHDLDTGEDPCAAPNVCECTVDSECGAHQFCSTASPGRTCECVNGYTNSVNGCIFSGVIKDPGFTDASKWTVTNGALVNTTAPGKIDAGEINFLKTSLCGYGTAEQDIGVPPVDRAEPLVIEVSVSNPPDAQPPRDGVDA